MSLLVSDQYFIFVFFLYIIVNKKFFLYIIVNKIPLVLRLYSVVSEKHYGSMVQPDWSKLGQWCSQIGRHWVNGAARLVEIGSMVKIQCQHLFLTRNDDQRFAIMTD